ncbi:MAG: formylmethanofuran dehydrogenase [Deltaproteobacteria bacterium]|nr:formylmethanofuran dehydrogenase [Deltaproteobacteria bacterium]
MHDHAHGRRAIDSMIRGQDLGGLLRLAETFHGHLCPFVSLGVKAGQYAMASLNRSNTGMEEIIAIVECNSCFTDGIQVVTGCTFGNNALIFKDLGKTAVTVARREDGMAVRLLVQPDYREQMFARYPNAEPLFQKIVVERQGTPEDWHRFEHMWEAIARRELKTPLEEQFVIESLTITLPEYARIYESRTCSRCGEQAMAPRTIGPATEPVCLVCAGKDFFMLTGQGITAVSPD